MMERLNDLAQHDFANVPKFPIWLNDRKPNAFGKVGNVIKVRDYGVVNWGEMIQSQLIEPIPFQLDAAEKRRQGIPCW